MRIAHTIRRDTRRSVYFGWLRNFCLRRSRFFTTPRSNQIIDSGNGYPVLKRAELTQPVRQCSANRALNITGADLRSKDLAPVNLFRLGLPTLARKPLLFNGSNFQGTYNRFMADE